MDAVSLGPMSDDEDPQLGPEDAEFARAAFQLILAGEPTPAEQSQCEQALRQLTEIRKQLKWPDATQRARSNLVHALLNHNDFVTVR